MFLGRVFILMESVAQPYLWLLGYGSRSGSILFGSVAVSSGPGPAKRTRLSGLHLEDLLLVYPNPILLCYYVNPLQGMVFSLSLREV